MFNDQSGRGLLGIRIGLPDGLLGRGEIDGGGASTTGLLGFPLPSVPVGNQPLSRDKGPDLAAAGDLRCEGYSAGCRNGGSYGATATHSVGGRNICTQCAIKKLGIENEPGAEQIRVLRPYSLGGP